MSGVFEPVTLTWDGRDYTIAADQVMRCIAAVEEVITLGELNEFSIKGQCPLARVAQAFGVVLRFAGCQVRDDVVYAGMFSKGGGNAARDAVQTLLLMMVPPSTYRGVPTSKKGAPASAASSSRRRTRPR